HADGIAVQGSRVTIKQNIIHSCTQAVYPNSFDYGPNAVSICDDVTICNNLIYQTRAIPHMNAINCDIETGGRSSMKRLKIYNNTIAGVDQYGINVGDRGHGGARLEGLEIFNNIVVDCGSYSSSGNISVSFKGPAPDPKINHNLIVSHRQKKPGYKFQGAARSQAQMKALGFEQHGKENYPIDAIFSKYDYQAPDNNYALPAGSPAIGMGLNPGGLCSHDLKGAPRPAEGPWDAGCFNYRPG
ncbi:MAG: choice-of-anchor Q domain-containing protein, partial [Syntrophaceae bacterium]